MDRIDNICIKGAASYVPPLKRSVADILNSELTDTMSAMDYEKAISDLGIAHVHACETEMPSELASNAAIQVLEQTGTNPQDIDVIADFTTLPQESFVPVWSLTNKLKDDIGAAKAFNIGFSHGGCSSLLVALKFTTALLTENTDWKTALLLSGERAVGGKRMLNSPNAATICGDGGSAVVLEKNDTGGSRIIGTEITTIGSMHDVLNIPGGGFIHPTDHEQFKLVLDWDRYKDVFSQQAEEIFSKMTGKLFSPLGLDLDQIKCFICPNISSENRKEMAEIFHTDEDRICSQNISGYGHIQSTDLIINYISAISDNSLKKGDYLLFCSHGFGFTWGVTLLQY